MRNKTEEIQLFISVPRYDLAIIKIITPKQFKFDIRVKLNQLFIVYCNTLSRGSYSVCALPKSYYYCDLIMASLTS